MALSRVRFRDHVRLLIKRGDWSTVTKLSRLKKCKYNHWYFKGFRDRGDGLMVWDEGLSRTAAGFNTE